MSNLVLFISFASSDGADFANALYEHYKELEYEVFMSKSSIHAGEDFVNKISNNISICNIFISLITPEALTSNWVEWEFYEARKFGKNVVPCIYHNIKRSDLRWGVDTIQQIRFDSQYSLIRELDAWFFNEIPSYENPTANRIRIKKDLELIRGGVKKDIDYNEVIKFLEKDQKKDMRDIMSLHNICKRLASSGKLEESLYCFEKAIGLDPNNAFGYNGFAWKDMGVILIQLGRYDEAIHCFDKSLVLNPQGFVSFYHRAISKAKKGDTEGALEDLRKFFEIGRGQSDLDFPKEHWVNLANQEKGFDSLRNDYRFRTLLM